LRVEGDRGEGELLLQQLEAVADRLTERQLDRIGEAVVAARDEVPVLDAVLQRERAEDFGQFGDRLVRALAAPAPRRVLAVEALHRAAREEDAAGAAFSRQRRFLAEMRSPAEDARRIPRAAESRPLAALPRTKLAFRKVD